jgi:hypothetical protein
VIDESVVVPPLKPGDRVVAGGGWPETEGRTFSVMVADYDNTGIVQVRGSDGHPRRFHLRDLSREPTR